MVVAKCREGRSRRWGFLQRVTGMAATAALVVVLGGAAAAAGPLQTSGAAGATSGGTATSVPTQAQITATQAQVTAIETKIATEQQQEAALTQEYDAAEQQIAVVHQALGATAAKVKATKARIKADRAQLAKDALEAYVLGVGTTDVPAVFTTGENSAGARTEYETTAIGDISTASAALRGEQDKLVATEEVQRSQEKQAEQAAATARTLEQQNQAATAADEATLQQVKGTLAQEVAAAAQAKAEAEAAAAAAARSAAEAQAAAAAAAQAALVAGAVGGATAGAAAITVANQAASSAANHSGGTSSGGISSGGTSSGGTGTGTGSAPPSTPAPPAAVTLNHVGPNGQTNPAGNEAVNAAISQLGVPYVWGGETPGVGFDCSGLTQWSWAQAGVSIPRTATSQYHAVPHVPLSTLEPGDLLFYFNLDNDGIVDHVAMFVGSGPYGSQTIIQAPETGENVSYDRLYTYGLIAAGQP